MAEGLCFCRLRRPTSLPPLRAEPRKAPAAPVSARDGLRDAMLLPALTEDLGKSGVKSGPQLITARRRGPPSVEVVDMRALLGELDAKHAGVWLGSNSTRQTSAPR